MNCSSKMGCMKITRDERASGTTVRYRIRAAEVNAIAVPVEQWNRIAARVENLEQSWPIEWLPTAAGTAAGVAATALFSVLTLSAHGAPRTLLCVAAGVCGLVAGFLAVLYAVIRRERRSGANDLLDEMRTVAAPFREDQDHRP